MSAAEAKPPSIPRADGSGPRTTFQVDFVDVPERPGMTLAERARADAIWAESARRTPIAASFLTRERARSRRS